jgi:hypothetical protein
VDLLKARTTDLSCIVITHQLLLEAGLAEILDCLNREGIQVILCTTNCI